ncbi:NmrA family NAD(P)-binding protein [Frankia sp. CNm7]|uniref:NmrA family NAD(P)-binding protein n=1 Tax=Frankia nepalensis TaxID=1836974 RepID=A0A937RTY1_9ACTN|nr:NmrA family NAD(P)-binding protein [Frankia nepalensis]MBL7497590.1 NmrA family NAD(P)-binding protein [Frankia nepalensis]MBL7511776.1 NmrA family NAD(P)-binding protein [Frankia nepalensis]MBL7523983.1 NmrA family NAD(P)-binding protein [Frankia nepalensis]MBL7633279.1 NmrA family NAD(P)-binding protein [Frankia nepalensis]
MTTTNQRTVLVTGATGNVGRHVVAGLLTAGARVRALTRAPTRTDLPAAWHPTPTPTGSPVSVEVLGGDLLDPASIRAAAAGVDAAFLLWPYLTTDGAAAAVRALAEQAPHLVFLSATAVRDDAPPGQGDVYAQVEELIREATAATGGTWTFLRASGFATNTLGWAEQLATTGAVSWVYGKAARSLIHERDIADVAVATLLDDRHAGARHVLTGPESITQLDQVRILGEAAGVPARWEEIPTEAAREQMSAFAPPAFVDDALRYWATLVHEPEPVTDDVERITGHRARTFRTWATDHADAFRRST